MEPILHHITDTIDQTSLDTSPEIRTNMHGHRIYEPSRGSEYKEKHGHSKRWRNRVRVITATGLSLHDAEVLLRTGTKLRKAGERRDVRIKHAKALAGR